MGVGFILTPFGMARAIQKTVIILYKEKNMHQNWLIINAPHTKTENTMFEILGHF